MRAFCLILIVLLTGCGYKSDNRPDFLERHYTADPLKEINESAHLIRVVTNNADQNLLAAGVGTAIHYDEKYQRCIIATVDHHFPSDVNNSLTLISRWSSKNTESYEIGEVLFRNQELDIAIIAVESNSNSCCPVEVKDAPLKLGDEIIVAGNPKDGFGTVLQGIVAGYWDVPSMGSMIVSDINATPGFSGGPALDSNSRLIGIIRGTETIQSTNSAPRTYTLITPFADIFVYLQESVEQIIHQDN